MRLSELLARGPVDVAARVRARVKELGVQEILRRLGSRLRGLDEVALDVLSGLMVGRHVAVVGPVGVGKTTLAEALAEILKLSEPPYVEVACHSHMTAVDLTGDIDVAVVLQAGLDHPLSYIPGPIVMAHGGILILDEVNRLNPYSQAALLQAMQEHHIYVRGYRVRTDFLAIGTANPSEYEGVYDLAEALADRMKFVEVKVPSREILKAVLLWKAREALGELEVEVPSKLAELLARFAERARTAGIHVSVRSLGFALADAAARAWAERREIALADVRRSLLQNLTVSSESPGELVSSLLEKAIADDGGDR